MFTRKATRIMAAAVAVLSLSAGAGATLINLDINDAPHATAEEYTGDAVVGSALDQWNYLNPSSATNDTAANLIDSNGNATTVTFNIAGSGMGAFDHNGETNFLIDDYLYMISATGAAQATLTFSNLKPNTLYNLYIYSSAGNHIFPSSFTFGTTKPVPGGWSISDFNENENYAHFSISSDGSGTITGTMDTPGAFSFAVFNGFQLQGELPEPASLSLLGIAAGPLLLRRRR